MTLSLSSETAAIAANRASNDRLMVGVGEAVTIRANHAAQWTLPGGAVSSYGSGREREIVVAFNQPGRQTVSAAQGSHRGSLEFNVVEPSLRLLGEEIVAFPRHDQVEIRDRHGRLENYDPRDYFGLLLRLSGLFTPLGVSFSHLEFRENSCSSARWGYFSDRYGDFPVDYREAMEHPVGPWTWIGSDNRLGGEQGRDAAALVWQLPRLPMPIVSGTFQWQIPLEYRLNGQVRPMGTASQTFAIRPSGPPPTRAGVVPFTGAVIANKGANEARVEYQNGQVRSTTWVHRVEE